MQGLALASAQTVLTSWRAVRKPCPRAEGMMVGQNPRSDGEDARKRQRARLAACDLPEATLAGTPVPRLAIRRAVWWESVGSKMVLAAPQADTMHCALLRLQHSPLHDSASPYCIRPLAGADATMAGRVEGRTGQSGERKTVLLPIHHRFMHYGFWHTPQTQEKRNRTQCDTYGMDNVNGAALKEGMGGECSRPV